MNTGPLCVYNIIIYRHVSINIYYNCIFLNVEPKIDMIYMEYTQTIWEVYYIPYTVRYYSNEKTWHVHVHLSRGDRADIICNSIYTLHTTIMDKKKKENI